MDHHKIANAPAEFEILSILHESLLDSDMHVVSNAVASLSMFFKTHKGNFFSDEIDKIVVNDFELLASVHYDAPRPRAEPRPPLTSRTEVESIFTCQKLGYEEWICWACVSLMNIFPNTGGVFGVLSGMCTGVSVFFLIVSIFVILDSSIPVYSALLCTKGTSNTEEERSGEKEFV